MTTRFVLATLIGHVLTALPAAAAPDPMAPVLRLVDAINHASPSPPAGVFTSDSVVLDDFAPYRWSSPTTGADWYDALLGALPADRTAFLAMHARLSVGKPRFSRITGDAAYFVLPGTFIFNTDAKTRIRQTAAWIITERLVQGNWRIAGHAWAITAESPAPLQ